MNLYVHVPFCRGKCAYCAFYSESRFDKSLWSRYLSELERRFAAFSCDEPVKTLYIGGGTPTLPPVDCLKSFFALFRSSFPFAPDAEISIECNPETMSREKAELLAGFVNRVSMGAQSFSPVLLEAIGRTSKDPGQIGAAFRMLRSAGIRNIGLDLMYALPGEDMALLKRDLDSALELEPTHLSAYSLTLEEGTALAERKSLQVPSDDLSAEMWEFIGSYTAEILPRYEISNYAKGDYECRHNQAVWHGERYFGFGPAACSFDGVRRWTEPASLNGWLAGVPAEEDLIPRETRLAEIFMMGLRTVRGWRIPEFEEVTGNSLRCLERKIARLEENGLLLREGDVIRATRNGLLFWNVIAEELL